MKKLNNLGFGILEVILVIVGLGIIGGAVFYVHNANKKDNAAGQSSSSVKTSEAKKPDSEIKSGSGEWNTYVNHKLGFSVNIPKEFLSGSGKPCVKTNYVYDNYGNKVSAPTSYTPTEGLVPATVVQDGNDFYVTAKYTYQQTGLHDYGDGYVLASGCKKIETTSASIAENKKPDSSYLLDKFPISVVNVSSQTDIEKWAQKHFNDDTIFVAGTKADSSGWEDVKLNCSSNDPCTDFNFGFSLRYYKEKNKLAYIEFGQGGQLAKAGGESYYDQQIADSFRLN